MKIALICYPDVSLNDLTAFLTPFERLKHPTRNAAHGNFAAIFL